MQKLMALNRGEIAIRILRAADELGFRSVAIYSQEDRLSLHRFKADEAYLIGQGQGPVQAYLDAEVIVGLAQEKGVNYIHPGYGFLSENPALPRACEKAGIVFVGPSAEILERLGDKTSARRLAEQAGIPVVPGTEQPVVEPPPLDQVIQQIGFPLIIKAAFGGGGRGMRVVLKPEDFLERFQEASREAAASFGNGGVFLERYIRRARHIEVQILGDRQGNLLHLYERDCSVQRRHQKVVELAPAPGLDPRIRKELCEAALALGREAGYTSAGTVEFLVDVDTGEWFFMEVNPRVQVEHTVTEVVTGIDIVRSQIQIAQGLSLFGPEMALPRQEDVTVRGFALQCRVTTEDPSNGFMPDYGRISTYRSPAGFGIRLDGASAYGGAMITPYYDSLLVKVTSWGRGLEEACQRMDRSLREFRIRGVKTNIPFLENLVNHPSFRNGDTTTSFLDQRPELFQMQPRRDRATKLLAFLGDVIVNGNAEVAGKPRPASMLVPKKPIHDFAVPPSGTKLLLDTLGPDGFARWTRDQQRLLITDTTMRDAHQSLMATRVRTHDMLGIANHVAHRMAGLYSLELWGGATFDVAMRFLREDPWERLAQLREAIPNICFQMLLRASNAVGYSAYADNVVEAFIQEAAGAGMDIFRVFDSLNWLPNMEAAMAAVRKSGKVCEAAICYTGDILDPKRDKYPLTYYVRMAKELEKRGAHILAIKDMAGLCKPYAAYKLVKALKDETGLPIHFHTHDTSGINAASILKAAEAGADAADAAIASFSGTTSQPNLNSLVAALTNTERDTGLDLQGLNDCSDYWEAVRTHYQAFDAAPPAGTAEVYLHEMPGGQFTNLKAQAGSMGLGGRWTEIAHAYADVNLAFGDIVKVTPSSKVVGDMALFLVSHGLTMKEFMDQEEHHGLHLPNSVIDMFMGSLGEPDGGWPQRIQNIVLKGAEPRKGRPGAHLPPVDLEATRQALVAKVGHPVTNGDLMSHLMYPEVFLKFDEARQAYGDLAILPTPLYFYGMQKGEEISVDLEPGKALVIKFLTASEPHENGARTLYFELNGQPRETTVHDHALRVEAPVQPKADPAIPGEVGAPIPGLVSSIAVEPLQMVRKGDRLLVMEAMKMQTTLYAPMDGKVARLCTHPGQRVEAKDLLLVIE